MDEEKKSPEQINNMNFAKQMTTAVSSIDKLKESIASKKIYDTSTLKSMIESPDKNADKLQQQSEMMRAMNGILKEIQMYKANIPTYDHYLIVNDVNKFKTKEKLDKAYRNACIELERYNIKALCRWVIEKEIRLGEHYIYLQDGDNITYFEIPNSLCKITHMDGFMQGYSIKLNGITEKTLPAYPQDIQKLWQKYKNGQLNNDKNFVDNYYKISIDKGVVFGVELFESKLIPYYSGILLDLSRLGDMLNMDDETSYANNFKLIHQIIPSQDGKILVDYEEAYQYHQAVKNVLPDGVDCVSSPYDIKSIPLTSNATEVYNSINKLRNALYNGSGIDSSLFNSDNKTNNQMSIYSVIVDSVLAFKLLEYIKIWLNYIFMNNSALKNFKIVFTDSTIFNKEAKLQAIVNQSATYASKLEMLAVSGKTPLDAYNVLKMEELMSISEEMTPLANAHTQDSSELNDNGRPSADEEAEDPNVAPESEN